MRVLIACEFSGIVRDAFARRGHFAVSCDLLPSERPGPHLIGDVRKYLDARWDLMIAHPPCTYLSNAAVSRVYDRERLEHIQKSIWFFLELLHARIPKIAIENPIHHFLAREFIPKYAQKLVLNDFGSDWVKPTCFWLKNLPPLVPTNRIKIARTNWRGRSWKTRSRTHEELARAMAEQWG